MKAWLVQKEGGELKTPAMEGRVAQVPQDDLQYRVGLVVGAAAAAGSLLVEIETFLTQSELALSFLHHPCHRPQNPPPQKAANWALHSCGAGPTGDDTNGVDAAVEVLVCHHLCSCLYHGYFQSELAPCEEETVQAFDSRRAAAAAAVDRWCYSQATMSQSARQGRPARYEAAYAQIDPSPMGEGLALSLRWPRS